MDSQPHKFISMQYTNNTESNKNHKAATFLVLNKKPNKTQKRSLPIQQWRSFNCGKNPKFRVKVETLQLGLARITELNLQNPERQILLLLSATKPNQSMEAYNLRWTPAEEYKPVLYVGINVIFFFLIKFEKFSCSYDNNKVTIDKVCYLKPTSRKFIHISFLKYILRNINHMKIWNI